MSKSCRAAEQPVIARVADGARAGLRTATAQRGSPNVHAASGDRGAVSRMFSTKTDAFSGLGDTLPPRAPATRRETT